MLSVALVGRKLVVSKVKALFSDREADYHGCLDVTSASGYG